MIKLIYHVFFYFEKNKLISDTYFSINYKFRINIYSKNKYEINFLSKEIKYSVKYKLFE